MIGRGCIVKLKSDGPMMTVKSISEIGDTGHSRVYTVWFDNTGKEHNSDFHSDCLLCWDDGEFLIPNK